jgi:hypothetical protein
MMNECFKKRKNTFCLPKMKRKHQAINYYLKAKNKNRIFENVKEFPMKGLRKPGPSKL